MLQPTFFMIIKMLANSLATNAITTSSVVSSAASKVVRSNSTVNSGTTSKSVSFTPNKTLQLFSWSSGSAAILTVADAATPAADGSLASIAVPRLLTSVICSVTSAGKTKERVSYTRNEKPTMVELTVIGEDGGNSGSNGQINKLETLEATTVKTFEHSIAYIDDKGIQTIVKTPYYRIQDPLLDIITVTSSNGGSSNSGSSGGSGNGNGSNSVMVTGKLNNLHWSPKYLINLDNNYSVTSLALIAEVSNSGEKLEHIKTIIFSMMSLTDKEADSFNASARNYNVVQVQAKTAKLASAAALPTNEYQLASGVEEDTTDYSFTINGDYTINKDTAIPVWTESLGTAVEETAYIFVGKDKAFAGYNIELKKNLYLPAGSVTFMRDKGVYREVTMPKPVLNNLRITVATIPEITVASTNVVDNQGNMAGVQLHYLLHHNKELAEGLKEVKLVLSIADYLDSGNGYDKLTINADQPAPVHDTNRRELVWTVPLTTNSETTKFDCNFFLSSQA